MSQNYPRFQLQAPFQPAGDQAEAISKLSAGIIAGDQSSAFWHAGSAKPIP
jgi:excinuclease UvrABC helicase subunit UvrB